MTPFLGAGASLFERETHDPWTLGESLPKADELARMLAEKSRYPDPAGAKDLLRVSQYFEAARNEKELYKRLNEVFAIDYHPNTLHRFLAKLPAHLRALGKPPQLIITTNYDYTLERSFEEAGEPYDLVWYEAKKSDEAAFGKFWHKPPDGEAVVITSPNSYDAVAPNVRTVILKLHGTVVDRADAARNSFVVTENHYIDYLAGDIALPVKITQRMATTNFLFLGYSMRDWNMRVILSRAWGHRPLGTSSWAIQLEPEGAQAQIEEKLWKERSEVTPLYAPLNEYVARLEALVLAAAPEPAAGQTA